MSETEKSSTVVEIKRKKERKSDYRVLPLLEGLTFFDRDPYPEKGKKIKFYEKGDIPKNVSLKVRVDFSNENYFLPCKVTSILNSNMRVSNFKIYGDIGQYWEVRVNDNIYVHRNTLREIERSLKEGKQTPFIDFPKVPRIKK